MADQNTAEKKKAKKPESKKEEGKGFVFDVFSGDTLILFDLDKKKAAAGPTLRNITLSNLQAPKLGKVKSVPNSDKKEVTKDEPFAWHSREFLRKKCIGKQVSFVIEHKVENKEYGLVYLNPEQENLAEEIVANGWAKVKRPNYEINRPDLLHLIDLEEKATEKGLGIFNKNKKKAVREIIQPSFVDLFSKYEGKPVEATVEHVRSGNSLRALIQENDTKFSEVPLLLTGVQCRDVKPSGESEAFGKEAKFLTEYLSLHHDVTIFFEAFDKFNIYASVINENGTNVNEQLLMKGLATFVEWTASKSKFKDQFKAAEKYARDNHLRLWASPSGQKPVRKEEKKKGKSGKEINGTVTDIVTNTTLIVTDQNKKEHKITLSSIKAPRPIPPKDGESHEEAVERSLASEGKEFLRKKLLGKKVRCVFDYVKPSTVRPDKTKSEEKQTYSVYLNKNNIAVDLVSAGLAAPVSHRSGDPRSPDYSQLLMAEQTAKKANKGVHLDAKDAPVLHVADLTLDNDASKAKQRLPSLQRSGRLRGVVEYELGPTKLKIFVPKENCKIPLNLSGVKLPSKKKDDPLNKAAIEFTKSKVHQRDIEFDVLSLDKGGNFVGNVWYLEQGNKINLSASLLKEGFAAIIPGALRDNDNEREFIIAEENAKKARLNYWANYDPEEEAEKRRKKELEKEEKKKPKRELIHVIVTEIVDATKFYVQVVGPEIKQLEELMSNLASNTSEPCKPSKGDLVAAQFTSDDAWYRAQVLGSSSGEYRVFYIDYGNTEALPLSRIRKLDPAFTKLKPQAHEAKLAFVKPPPLNNEYGEEAAQFLSDSVEGKTMVANVEYREGDALYLTLGDTESNLVVNAAFLSEGLARIDRYKAKKSEMLDTLVEKENYARANHLCIWEYGDPGSDDEYS